MKHAAHAPETMKPADGTIKITRRSLLKSATAAATLAAAPAVLAGSHTAYGSRQRIRKNAATMPADAPFLRDYAEAVTAMHDLQKKKSSDQRSWRNQALIHLKYCPHGADDFFAWHRHYINFFERICGSLIGKPDFALGYWDWTRNAGRLPKPFFDNGPLNVTHWNDPSDASEVNRPRGETVTVATGPTRGLTATKGLQDDPRVGRVFSKEHIDGIMARTNFGSFQNGIEGQPHNVGHGLTAGGNGHMADFMSPLDPCFWLHHCNVDRLWAEWQTAGNETPAQAHVYKQQFVDDNAVSRNVDAGGTRAFEALGYTYDTLERAPNLVAARRLNLPTVESQPVIGGRAVATAEVTLGSAANSVVATQGVAAAIAVQTKGLIGSLFKSRKFHPTDIFAGTRVAIESGRVFARLKNLSVKGDVQNLVFNVFVNHPDIKAGATASDPHWAGTFSFFGKPPPKHVRHRSFSIDITEPLRKQAREGRIATGNVTVQLLPATLTSDASPAEAGLLVGKVEIFAG